MNQPIERNRIMFGDNYTLVRKYANQITCEDLRVLDYRPDCLFVDCEGCLKDFQETETGKYVLSNVRFIVNEMDGHNPEIIQQWLNAGFKPLATGYGCDDSTCDTEIYTNTMSMYKGPSCNQKSVPFVYPSLASYNDVYLMPQQLPPWFRIWVETHGYGIIKGETGGENDEEEGGKDEENDGG